jgi:hypothetical protein
MRLIINDDVVSGNSICIDLQGIIDSIDLVQKLYPTPAQNGTALVLGGQQTEVCETLLVDHEKGQRGDF